MLRIITLNTHRIVRDSNCYSIKILNKFEEDKWNFIKIA